MAIKIFLKHIFNGMVRRPLQPLLLVAIIAISMIVSTLGIELKYFMIEEVEMASDAKNGVANVVVEVSSASSQRFLYASDAKKVLPEGSSVCGTYDLPFYYGGTNDLIIGATTDLVDASGIFPIYADAGLDVTTLSSRQLRNGIIITQDLADEYDLEIGTNIPLRLFGYKFTYEVIAISPRLIMGQYNAVVDVASIAKEIALLSYIDPYGKLYIKTTGDVNQALESLEQVFPTEQVLAVTNLSKVVAKDMDAISNILIVLVCVLAVLVIYSCFAILAAQRKEENDLFYSVGAKSYMLNLASVVEMFVYWAIGAGVAVALSAPLSKLFVKAVDMVYCQGDVIPSVLATTAGAMLASAEVSTAMSIVAERLKRYAVARKKVVGEEKTFRNTAIITGALIVLDIIITIISSTGPIKENRTSSIIAILITFITIFFAGKVVFWSVSSWASKRDKLPVTVRYALKNCTKSSSQSNIAGLIGLFVVVTILLGLMLNFNSGYIEAGEKIINADYVMTGITEASYHTLKDDVDGIESVYRAAEFRVEVDSQSVLTFGASDLIAYAEYDIEELPIGDKVVMGETMLKYMNKELGDTITFTYEGKEYTHTIVGTAKINANCIFVDVESLGLSYNYVAIKVKDGYDKELVLGAIMESLTNDSVAIAPVSKILESKLTNLRIYYSCVALAYICLAVFAVIGISDNVGESYRSRKDEFACYAAAGMNKSSLRKMKTAEIVFAIACGLIVTLVFVGVAILNMYEIGLSNMLDFLMYI